MSTESQRFVFSIRDRGSDLYVGMEVVKLFCLYKKDRSKNLKTRAKSPKKDMYEMSTSIEFMLKNYIVNGVMQEWGKHVLSCFFPFLIPAS